MGQELLAILDQLEREKGIKKEVLVEAVESAILSAVRKTLNISPNEELRVELDRATGKIRAFKDKEEIKSMDFGRISASIARQVIIQKIREAEKDVVFNEFQGKVSELVSGTVYRFDKGNIIVDLLGKATGVLLKREQSPKEEFRQGQRICAYIVEVKKDTRGPQIILSRTHPNLLKKLFELEIPEIYEGIVEIKSISREPGARSKIAVRSKNEKVDSVGACVGMRGNRIRNIVNELQGEKIDIVRYSEDIREYIKAALAPAKISEIKLDKERLKAEIIVDDDQLSLSIGKHGQNVRLASRLVGWELDIRTKATSAAAVKEEKEGKEAKKEKEEKTEKETKETSTLAQLPGIGEKTIENLSAAGFKTIEDILKAKIEDLTQVKGIAEKKAKKIIEEAKKARK
ncbi:MAG: transcription termination factor NusA [Candidatus Omnitrophica bacterium]|nr:transcription termination factor NusA [Candidatus Omnitrophota bacterium]MDD5592389.1 transcription termination factor NusA [Candidatus Omnitrophota bacterium]